MGATNRMGSRTKGRNIIETPLSQRSGPALRRLWPCHGLGRTDCTASGLTGKRRRKRVTEDCSSSGDRHDVASPDTGASVQRGLHPCPVTVKGYRPQRRLHPFCGAACCGVRRRLRPGGRCGPLVVRGMLPAARKGPMRPASIMTFVVAFLALSVVADKSAMFVGLSLPAETDLAASLAPLPSGALAKPSRSAVPRTQRASRWPCDTTLCTRATSAPSSRCPRDRLVSQRERTPSSR